MQTQAVLPKGPKGLPIIGCGPQMARDPLAFMLELSSNWGDLASPYFPRQPTVAVNSPALVEELLLERHRDCIKDLVTRQLIPLLGQGLLTSEGNFWRHQRKLAAPPLQPKRIEGYAQTMVQYTERCVARFRDDEVRDVHADMMQLTLEIVGSTLLGFDTRQDAERVGLALEALIHYFDRRLFSLEGLLPDSVPTPSRARFERAVAEVDDIIYRLIKRCRSQDHEAEHLLSRLTRARGDDGQAMSDQQLRDEAVTMLLAGHETTALLLTFAIYLLSQNPASYSRLRVELKSVLADRPASAADLEQLPYLDAVLRETLRLYPPAWAIGRQVVKPFSLGGYELAVGTQILCSPYALHRNPKYFPEPTKFMPERWLEPHAQPQRYAYLPFGAGPRVCIGNHFAKMEAALVLATLLRRVHLRVVPGYKLELSAVITMRPKRGMPVLVRRMAHAPKSLHAFNASLAPPLARH